MKTTSVLTVLIMAVFSTVYGGNPSNEKNKSLTIETSAWKSKTINVQIREASGNLILEENVETGKDLRRYNLKNLPVGNYTLEISDDLKVSVQSFAITSSGVELETRPEVTFKPVISWADNNLDVNYLTFGERTFVNVSDKTGKTFFSETLKSPSIHRRYNTADLPSGVYTVSVYNSKMSFEKEFTK